MGLNVKKAIKFIEQNGNEFQKSYAKCLFGKNNLPETLYCLEKYQNPDGGWFQLDPDYTGLESSITCAMLAFAKYERLNITNSESLDRSIRYLKKVQKLNGSWDEPVQILKYQIPSWYYPKVLKNQLWFTNGMLRYVISRKPEEKEMIEKARQYLREFWDGSRFPGYEHHNWMGIVSFYQTGRKEDEKIYQGCLKNLERNLDSYDIADIAWTLESLVFLKLPKTDHIVQKTINRLVEGQQEDGGFGTSYGHTQRVDVTIEAIDSLAGYGEFPRMIYHKRG